MDLEYRGDLAAVFRNSGFIARRGLLKSVKAMLGHAGIAPGSSWLDVGCGLRPYQEFFAAGRYVGLDIPGSGRALDLKKPDLFYDGHTLPVPDGSFDGVICTQVLEHAVDPEALLREITRALKGGGTAVLTFPFVWPQHEKPYDFLRFTEFKARRIVEESGLCVERLEKTTGSVGTLAQLIATYLSQELISKLPIGRGIAVAALCGPVQLAGLALQAVLPDSQDLYLDNSILARKR